MYCLNHTGKCIMTRAKRGAYLDGMLNTVDELMLKFTNEEMIRFSKEVEMNS